MQMSKCLCIMIIAVIVTAANASPAREKRGGSSGCKDNGQGSNGNNNGKNWNGGNGQNNWNGGTTYYISPNYQNQANTDYNNEQTNVASTTNSCNGPNQYCCNNDASSNSNTNGRRKRGGGSNSPIFYIQHPTNSNKQYACGQAATNGASGSQTTGCSTNQSCCQGNNGTSLVSLSCSGLNL
ncbi:unnamed protein product [Adineta steineri]|uniref:Hydrophobin n=1 Tax=Adineta steineri TaxID=433720 RepID=A0A815L617_9BILA|nr:unnamed protein product [Adineta steineri]CAF1464309.1 unnamed protein product [Adineta steineri]CAF3813176.1 unnamed protein product [Adineta steineri]CAF3833902.1 unnamed protein product [Adineta steineri]